MNLPPLYVIAALMGGTGACSANAVLFPPAGAPMTRQQYLDQAGVPGAHRAYYAQFVDERVRALVARTIGMSDIAQSRDPEHFNDIRLQRWDAIVQSLPHGIAAKMKELGDYLTLAGGVCILKEAARQLVEESEGVRR